MQRSQGNDSNDIFLDNNRRKQHDIKQIDIK
jgi:hypothetical protein